MKNLRNLKVGFKLLFIYNEFGTMTIKRKMAIPTFCQRAR